MNSPARLAPPPIGEVVARLTTCLALVRPAGMSDQAVEEWLRVAAQEVCYLPADLLAEGCAAARRTCTLPGQIIPAIIKATDERMKDRRELCAPKPRRHVPEPPKQERWKPEPGELERIKQEAAEMLRADRGQG